jgi:hypothetical protein
LERPPVWSFEFAGTSGAPGEPMKAGFPALVMVAVMVAVLAAVSAAFSAAVTK